MTKGRNLKINFIVALFSQLMSVIFAFIVPKMMIRYYGPQMHGVISTITNLITYLILVHNFIRNGSINTEINAITIEIAIHISIFLKYFLNSSCKLVSFFKNIY